MTGPSAGEVLALVALLIEKHQAARAAGEAVRADVTEATFDAYHEADRIWESALADLVDVGLPHAQALALAAQQAVPEAQEAGPVQGRTAENNPYADLGGLGALILRLPPQVGLDLRFWNDGSELNDAPTIGIVWGAYTTGREQVDYGQDVEGCHGWTIEGPRAAAEYISEYLEPILAPAPADAVLAETAPRAEA